MSRDKLLATLDFTRPFTLIAPLFGFISGGLCAYGVGNHSISLIQLLQILVTGGVAASLLNIGSNGLNQIFDIKIDIHNKPDRVLPSRRLNFQEAYFVTIFCYVGALVMAYYIGMETFFIFIAATICTYLYSVWPRTKKHWLFANVTIATARGILLKVAGWSAVASIFAVEPWLIGLIFGLFLLGAASTKDFSDLEGDLLGGCITLPLKFGITRAAYMMAPFLVLPFLLINLWAGSFLTGNLFILHLMGIIMALWGLYVSYLILRNPKAMAIETNHPSWKHMYLMMIMGQIGFAIAYL